MTYTLSGLPREPFLPYFAVSDVQLEQNGKKGVTADTNCGLACRIGLRDASVRLLLAGPRIAYIMGDFAADGCSAVRIGRQADAGDAA